MTLFDVEELVAYWGEHPPAHILFAAYLGLGRGCAPARPTRDASDPAAVLGALGPGFQSGDVHAGLAPAALDFAELKSRQGGGL